MSGGDRQISEPSKGTIHTAFLNLQEQAKASEEKLLQMLVRSLGIDTEPVAFFGVSGQLDLVLQNWWKSQLPPKESSQPLGEKDDLDLFKVFCFTFYHIKSPENQNLGEYSMNFSEHLKQI